MPSPSLKRKVWLHVESNKIDQKSDKQKETRYSSFQNELNFLITLTEEAYNELKAYDQDDDGMYLINLSTMDRVFGFSSFTIFILVGLGVWEVYYLYSFFKQKVFYD